MVKKSKNAQRKRGVQPKSRAQVIARLPRALSLDTAAATYAKLLADPCNGPLVTGPFGDGGGGMVTRFESDFLYNVNATETASAFAFVPGLAIGYTGSVVLPFDNTSFNFLANTGASPGYQWLNTNASQWRCLSACVQVYYPGTELNRSGLVSVGCLPAEFALATGQQVNQLRTLSQYVERTPDMMSEIIWRPNSYDLEFTTPQGETPATASRRSALYATGSGLPLATGLRYRVVAVYEWYPVNNIGMVTPINRGQTSTSTFQQVIHRLDGIGDWMYHGALETAKAASSVYRGVRAVGQVAYGTAKMAAMLSG
jgi:hypothetical protein